VCWVLRDKLMDPNELIGGLYGSMPKIHLC
jgi:hypothetical protein